MVIVQYYPRSLINIFRLATKTKMSVTAQNKSVIVRQQRDFGLSPLYAIAHNPNTIRKVEEALDAGANAIEPDVNIYNGKTFVNKITR